MESSDTSSISTNTSIIKDPTPKQKRGIRQRVRDVVADLGNPPTARDDGKSDTVIVGGSLPRGNYHL